MADTNGAAQARRLTGPGPAGDGTSHAPDRGTVSRIPQRTQPDHPVSPVARTVWGEWIFLCPAAYLDGDCGSRSAAGLRERRQSSAGTFRGQKARTGRAAFDGCKSMASGPSTIGREFDARSPRRSFGGPDHDLDGEDFHQVHTSNEFTHLTRCQN